MTTYFGTDGIRGRAGSELTTQIVHLAAFGFALCCEARGVHRSRRPIVVLGRDSRSSSPMLAGAVASGIMLGGMDVLDLGIVPTPLVPFEILRRKCVGGVMITASHNPVHDNGVKFFSRDGRKISTSAEAAIEEVISKAETAVGASNRGFGSIVGCDPTEDYLRFAQKAAGAGGRQAGMRVVLDCAYGAASQLGPKAFERCGFEVKAICADFDGSKINVSCGATHLETLSRAVRRESADFGLAFDGDADRVLAVDHLGRTVSGDKIIALLATRISRFKKQGAVVMTHMTNLGVEQALAKRGIAMRRTEVGDAKVAAEMERLGLDLGGEQSGHVIMRDLLPSGDGILTGLRLACAIRASGKQLAELVEPYTEYPQVLTNLKVKDKSGWQRDKQLSKKLASIKGSFSEVRFYIRPSGTENLLRVLTEARDSAQCSSSNQAVCDALLQWDASR